MELWVKTLHEGGPRDLQASDLLALLYVLLTVQVKSLHGTTWTSVAGCTAASSHGPRLELDAAKELPS